MTQFFTRTRYGQRPRTVPKALFDADADIIPEPEKDIPRARIPGMAGKAMDKTVAPLPEALNETVTKFPNTDLQLVCELPGWDENMVTTQVPDSLIQLFPCPLSPIAPYRQDIADCPAS